MVKAVLEALEGEVRILPLEDIYGMYLDELEWNGCSEADRARCGALDLEELVRVQKNLWRQVRKEAARQTPGSVFYQLSPEQGWSQDFLLLNQQGGALLEDGRLDLRGGYVKVRGKMDPLMSAAYTGGRQAPGEEAVLRLLMAVCFSSMRAAILAQPVPLPVYGVMRDRPGRLRLV